MKLDRLKFATLIGYIGYRTQFPFSKHDIAEIDELTDIDVTPVEVPGKADPATVNELMRAIHAGEMIAAIKAYRTLTGDGLKDAKDAVEKDWVVAPSWTKAALCKKLNLWATSDSENSTVAKFIGSL